ncbi:helix-turn-helix domain-containing protein [Enterococcus sp. CWB-B31]|uniref:helix-turn-helix domain-containing protein n=1 Tax=Enterococcus sp. CWB-B31 TaxID=2885159 RepID=UPI001E64EC3F|nr:helix-turn-helix domain-containing protein [Enterococcus sp. CWB-B31]MCB5955600.1 helix-turn-helix domain-containing protein [Enterococcus sp. CWB-B31]
MADNLIEVGNRIRGIRRKHNYSMASFAKLVGNSSASTVNNWEKGNNLPKTDRLEKIAILGNTTVEWIKFGDFKNYVENLLTASTPSLRISEEQLDQLINTLHARHISYGDDLKILTEARTVFPKLFEQVYPYQLSEAHSLIAESEPEYHIESDSNYRKQLLPLIDKLSKEPQKMKLWAAGAELLIEDDSRFINLLQNYINEDTPK